MKKYGVIFDFDGTLADTSKGVLDSVEYALEKMGAPSFDRRVLRGFIGPSLYESFQEIAGLSPEDSVRAIEYYRSYYQPKGIYECNLYPGMKELLKELSDKGVCLSVASSKPQVSLDVVTKHLGIDGFFDKIVGAELSVKTSDKLTLVKRAALNENNVMAGDAVFDVRAAHAAGFTSVAVTYGFNDRETLEKENPDFIADSVSELREVINKICF